MKCKNFGKDNQLLLFDVLNYIVEQGNMYIWVSVSSKKFLTFILDILKSQTDAEIQTKLLQLIQNWGIDFENKKEVIPNFYKIYNKFKVNGVVFPPREESNYYKYILKNPSSKPNYKNEDNKNNEDYEDNEEKNDYTNDNEEFSYMESIKNKLKASNFEHKYRRLVAFLAKMHDNIKIANISIDNRNINNLKEAISTIKKGNKTLIDTIGSGRLKDEKLMEITLGTTEDINQTLSREEEMKSGNRPNKFMSYFVLNEIIPIKNNNNNNKRAKSEKKKVNLNQRNNFNKNNQNNNDNSNNNNNIKNIDDIFGLFSSNQPKATNETSNFSGNMFNNNNNNENNNMISNYYSNQNQNINNNFNNNNNNNFNNFNTNNDNRMMNSQINNNNNFNQNNFNNNNGNNQMNNIDLLQGSINLNNQQNNNISNMNNINNNQNKRYNPNEFDMYGPPPEINSNQLVQYIGTFDNNNNNNNGNNNNNNNNNNNQFSNFNGNNQNNNMFSQNQGNSNFDNNNMMSNNMGNNMNNNFGQQMTQEEIEREQRLKELDDLF